MREAKSCQPEEYACGATKFYALPKDLLNGRTWAAFRIAQPSEISKTVLIDWTPVL
jgi:hypothetical protein